MTARLLICASVFVATAVAKEPAPVPSGYDTPNKTDVFHAGPEVYHVGGHHSTGEKSSDQGAGRRSHGKAPTARLDRGEIVQVMSCSRWDRPELAFYLPPEATSFVQLVIEKKGSQRNFFVKGLRSGRTVGGAVERGWLDSTGFKPRNMADEARIQSALKENPLYIEVR